MPTEGTQVLTESQRRLYARHVLLGELGASGQARLCASAVSIARDAAPAAAAVAREYLERAGVQVGGEPAVAEVEMATREDVERLAGDPLLEDCAAWLAGAWAAVEAIKRCADVGHEASITGGGVASLIANEEMG
jgi:hypothetical protein